MQSSIHESNRVYYIEYFGIQRTVVPSSWATSIWPPKFATVIYSAWLLIFHMFWHLTLQSRKLVGLKSDFTEYFDETPEHLAYCNRNCSNNSDSDFFREEQCVVCYSSYLQILILIETTFEKDCNCAFTKIDLYIYIWDHLNKTWSQK